MEPDELMLTQGYFGALHVENHQGHKAVFPGKAETGRWKRIITGKRNKWGECEVLSARDVRALYRVTPKLKNPYDKILVPDKYGLLDAISADDILRHAKRAHGVIPISLGALADAVAGRASKLRRVT